MLTTVEVTQEHIDGKHYCCSRRCAVSLAIAAKLAENAHVSVGLACAAFFVGVPPTVKSFPESALPASAQEFIRAFDDEREVFPFTFSMFIPQEALA